MSTVASHDTYVRALVAHSRASDEIPSKGTQGPTGIGEYVVVCAGARHPAPILCTESKEVLYWRDEEVIVPAKRMRTVLIQHEWSTEELYT